MTPSTGPAPPLRRYRDIPGPPRDRTKARLLRLYGALEARFGPQLLAVPGLGPETVDAILLYAGGRPVFVVDVYTRRVLARHRLIPSGVSYEALRSFLEAHLPSDPRLFKEYHALLVAAGKRYCRSVPLCRECPLRRDLRGRPPRAV